ncbi:hypothetical protein MOMA_03925 [Moraxella macacae 0408225]|uniref:ATP/GTP-binding protein n=1 Tax=Moraxella macacae 0408225 TaxID=1230338 RepID=L2F9T1_9GAMM|nr:HpcH/HpaI aldolase/citrate lyase family protein [Moraxella macacae]ELA09521.1 hypothetical protein MOMA_03925 [Moraxella macacae 0408225]
MTILNLPNHTILPIAPPRLHPYHLGASLYMPATRLDILAVIKREKLENINSIIICLEDSIHDNDVARALTNLQNLLKNWQQQQTDNPKLFLPRPLVFIRPRHAKMLRELVEVAKIEMVDGFVLPKVDMASLANWRLATQHLDKAKFLMPTLETASIFHATHNDELAIALTESFTQQILALRIGGNDLLSCLRLRRPQDITLYQSPIGALIYRLLGCFVPYGFYLTAPVCEFLDKPELLNSEVQQDVALGLVGKTVIHPSQIAIVQNAFQVSADELTQAGAILHADAKAVFKQDNTMLEPATHKNWAMEVLTRHDVFGLKQQQ